MREEYLAIQANIQETIRQLKASGLMDKMGQLDQSLASNHREKEILTSHNSELRRRIDQLTKNVLKHKTSIEHQIAEIADKPVAIETP
jgi:regulator of replication initiation timing